MRRMRLTVTLVSILILSLFLVDLGQVHAVQSFNPNPPIAGQSFTIVDLVAWGGPALWLQSIKQVLVAGTATRWLSKAHSTGYTTAAAQVLTQPLFPLSRREHTAR